MGKIDLNLYFLEIQNQYFEVKSDLKELKELVAEGRISEEEYLNRASDIQKLEDTYLTLSYANYLINLPSAKNSKKRSVNKKWYKELKGYSREAVLDENKNILKDLDTLIKQGGYNSGK